MVITLMLRLKQLDIILSTQSSALFTIMSIFAYFGKFRYCFSPQHDAICTKTLHL